VAPGWIAYPRPVAGLDLPAFELAAPDDELKLLRAVVDHVPAMLGYWDTQQRCRFANRAYETWFGVTPDALLGRSMHELLGPIYALNLPYIEAALRGERQAFEREIPDPRGGAPRYSQAHYIPDLVDGQVRGFYVLVADISQRRRFEQELRAAKERADVLATHDALTGLPNRLLLEDRARTAIELARRKQRLGVLAFVDMDDFKAINDTHGHAAGDSVLRGVGARLTATLRSWDTVARLGGDEFVILLPEVADEAAAEAACERLLAAVTGAPFEHEGHAIAGSFSLGAALFPRDGDELPTLLARADTALYAAKHAGKRRVAAYHRL